MTNRRRLLTTLLILSCAFASHQIVSAAPRHPLLRSGEPQRAAESGPVVIPFELVTRHILIRVRINNSDPLWFIFDTGDKVAIVDSGRARSLGLNLQGEINVGGAGAGTLKGSYVRDASLSVMGLEGNPQPVVLAVPLEGLEPRFGHDIDGIIGADFIKQFVVEVDYPARVLRLHDKNKFAYTGSGEILPLTFIHGGHPIMDAEVTVTGRPAIKGRFVLDFGSGASLALHRPFVEQENLPGPSQKTIRTMGGGGVGGKVTGRSGRIASLRIGKFQIDNPLALFSEDKSGAFASSQIQGNIGAQILSKFKVLLDYDRNRIIFEPNASFKDPIGSASSGLRFIAEGSDYKTFRVEELLEDSPATEAGIQQDDVVVAVDGRPAAELTLSSLHELFEKPVPRKLSVRRKGQTLQITLTPRRLI
ncbi:MAG: aspartyl protease family protein [Acidobacteriota bacterium]